MNTKIKVNYYDRKPHIGANFSIEFVFNDVRDKLKDKINARVYISSFYNIGFLRKIANIVETVFREKKDICHITGESHYLNLLMPKKRVVLTIHDCGMMQRKEGFQKLLIKYLYLYLPIRKSSIVTTVSNATKQDIIRWTKCDSDKIKIVPVAVNSLFQPHCKTFNHTCPNILQIGTGYNKNLFNLIEALKGINCHLTIIGRLSDIQIASLKKNKINYFNEYNISNERLLIKYQEADIVSFISTAEGFGMPIIEANSVERVVITSNISSMPEVAGDAACLVNPFDVSSIKQGFEKIIADSDYRELLIAKGRLNKLRFNGDTIANMYYDIYHAIKKN